MRFLRWLFGSLAGAVLLFLYGLPGHVEDFAGWRSWLNWIDSETARWIVTVVCLAVIAATALLRRTPEQAPSDPSSASEQLLDIARRHKASGERLRERLQSTHSVLGRRALDAEVDAWERAAYADLVRFDDTAPFVGSQYIAGDLSPSQVFRPSNVRFLESHLREEPGGLRPGSDPVLAFLDAKLGWLTAMIGPDEDVDRSQAENVSIWPSSPIVEDPDRAPRNRRYTAVTVRNGSDRPIRSVFVQAKVGNTTCGIDNIEVLPPGHEQTFDVPPDYQVMPGVGADVLRVVFMDANGNRWEQDGNGRLWARL